jgi:molybdenum cofactor cytidylyltransferase
VIEATSAKNDCDPGIAVVILAAGESARMGSSKQLLTYRGRTLLRRAAESATKSIADTVIVVLGAEADRLHEELAGLDVRIIYNPHWEEGIASSIRAGVEASQAGGLPVEAVVLMLCDQPLITFETIDQIIEAHRATGKPLVATRYEDSLGVPALFARPLFSELLSLRGPEGAKKVLKRHETDVHPISIPEGAVMDIDTPADYSRLLERPAEE